jgi:hypothetical protein
LVVVSRYQATAVVMAGAHATANVDNVFALFMSPTDRLVRALRDELGREH